jgi:hypothetical protein
MNPMNRVTATEAGDLSLKRLYKLAGTAAIFMVVIILAQLAVFITAPPPLEGTVMDWFELFQKNAMIGLLDFGSDGGLCHSFIPPVALYMALRRMMRHLPALSDSRAGGDVHSYRW